MYVNGGMPIATSKCSKWLSSVGGGPKNLKLMYIFQGMVSIMNVFNDWGISKQTKPDTVIYANLEAWP